MPPYIRALNVPILGSIAAGQPILAQENIEDTFPLPLKLAGDEEKVFMLRVKGDSMVDAGIFDGDLVAVRQQATARNGEIVAAMIEDEATVKRFYKEGRQVRLQAENSAYPPIFAESVRILGKVILGPHVLSSEAGRGLEPPVQQCFSPPPGMSSDPREMGAALARLREPGWGAGHAIARRCRAGSGCARCARGSKTPASLWRQPLPPQNESSWTPSLAPRRRPRGAGPLRRRRAGAWRGADPLPLGRGSPNPAGPRAPHPANHARETRARLAGSLAAAARRAEAQGER